MNIDYNFILEKIILKIGGIVVKSSLIDELKEVRKYNTYSTEQFEKLQYKKLSALLEFATQNTEYYEEFKLYRTENPYEWLKFFPIIGKKEVNESGRKMQTLPLNDLIAEKSSGSSGVQSTVYLSFQDQDLERAVQLLWWEWAGYKLGDPVLQTGIAAKRTFLKKLKDFFFRTYYIKAFDHKEDDIVKALLWAAKKKEPVLAGYASSLYVIAEMAMKKRINVHFKTAISFGDKLFPHYRNAIKKAFNCKVYETYGSAEGFRIAAQKDLEQMYVMSPNVVLEIIDDKGNIVRDGEIGHVVVTNLNGYGMPLIRYKLGDMAIKLPSNEYPPIREVQLPLLKKVIGRDTDIVKTPSGNSLVVHSFTGIFEHIKEINQFAVVQNNLNGILIKYIPGDGFNTTILEQVKARIQNLIKEEFKIKFEEVKYIPPTPSGKPQIIISNLKRKNYQF